MVQFLIPEMMFVIPRAERGSEVEKNVELVYVLPVEKKQSQASWLKLGDVV